MKKWFLIATLLALVLVGVGYAQREQLRSLSLAVLTPAFGAFHRPPPAWTLPPPPPFPGTDPAHVAPVTHDPAFSFLEQPPRTQVAFSSVRDARDGFSFELPSDWVATSSDGFSMESRNVSWYTGPCEAHAYECFPDSWQTGGISIAISSQPVDGSIATPEAYASFNERLIGDCSNCPHYQRISLEGIPADIQLITGISGPEKDKPVAVLVKFFYRNRAYQVVFSFASFSDDAQATISRFVKTFHFTP